MNRHRRARAAALALGLAALSCATTKGKQPGSDTSWEPSRSDDVLTILPPGTQGSYTKTELKRHLASLGA